MEPNLVLACEIGNFERVKSILEEYPMIAKHGSDHTNPLVHPCLVVAAARGYHTIVELLLSNGADPTDSNLEMENAFHVACRGGHFKVLEVLIAKTIKTGESPPPVDLGTSVDDLFEFVPMDAQNSNGDTPFKLALEAYQKSTTSQRTRAADYCIRQLLSVGAEPGISPTSYLLDPISIAFSFFFFVPCPLDETVKAYVREYQDTPHRIKLRRFKAADTGMSFLNPFAYFM